MSRVSIAKYAATAVCIILIVGVLVIGITVKDAHTAWCYEDCGFQTFMGADGTSYIRGENRADDAFGYLDSTRASGINFYGDENVVWRTMEPDPPAGGPVYYWSNFDKVIKYVEGVEGDVFPTILSSSDWATVVPAPVVRPSSMPLPQYEQSYYDFIKAFMERYDKDGIDDMPGLMYAHNYLQIEDEAENLGDAWRVSPACNPYINDVRAYYKCAADEYGRTLKLAYLAAKDASEDSMIASFSFNPGDYFDNNPVQAPPMNMKLVFMDRIFREYSDYFDIIAVQCNYNYTGIPGWLDYIKKKYNLDKPVICSDAATMPMLGQQQFQPADKYTYRFPFKTDLEILDIMDQGNTHPEYHEIMVWWEQEKAKLSFKKAVVAAHAGADNIFFQFIMSDGGRQNPWSHSGMLSAGLDREDKGPKGTPQPLVYALKDLYNLAGDFRSIENLNPIQPGQDPSNWLWIYKLNDAPAIYVVWKESDGETVDLSGFIPAKFIRSRAIITRLDDEFSPVKPEIKKYPVYAVPVSSVPVFMR